MRRYRGLAALGDAASSNSRPSAQAESGVAERAAPAAFRCRALPSSS